LSFKTSGFGPGADLGLSGFLRFFLGMFILLPSGGQRMDKADLPSALLKFLETQRQNQIMFLDCAERVYALEVVLGALDSRASVLLQQQKDKVHAQNQKQREQIDSTFLALQALVSRFPSAPN
jgi:hypothetical protein